MKNPPKYFNNFSKDYEKLYELLCEGFVMVAFVNYLFSRDDDTVYREVCKIVKRNDFDIDFSVRGLSFGKVSDYFKDTKTEKELFLKMCKMLNVEWIS